MPSIFTMTILALMLAACGSSTPKPRKFKLPYEVVNAQQGLVPKWIQAPQEWAQEFDADEVKNHRYFVYDTEPKGSRSLACKLAQTQASATIAGEITQFIKDSLAFGQEGDPSQGSHQIQEYIEFTLVREVQSSVVGARVHRTYWEHRAYKTELGAKKDEQGYTCAALIKISQKNLEQAILRTHKKLEAQVESQIAPPKRPAIKQALKEALQDTQQKLSSP